MHDLENDIHLCIDYRDNSIIFVYRTVGKWRAPKDRYNPNESFFVRQRNRYYEIRPDLHPDPPEPWPEPLTTHEHVIVKQVYSDGILYIYLLPQEHYLEFLGKQREAKLYDQIINRYSELPF